MTLLTVLLNAATLLGWEGLGKSVLLPLLVMLSFAVIGAIDDWEGVQGQRKGLGMRAPKLALQLIVGLGAALGLKYVLDVTSTGRELNNPLI